MAINFISGKPSLSWTHTRTQREIFRELKNKKRLYVIVYVFRDLDNKALLYSIKILLILYRFEIDNYFIYIYTRVCIIYFNVHVRVSTYTRIAYKYAFIYIYMYHKCMYIRS